MTSTYNDVNTCIASSKIGRIIFVVIVFIMLLIPLVGMIWAPTNESIEKKELAPWPQLYDEKTGFNTNILSELGDYFSDHYAYRVTMIDAGARLYSDVFGVSTADTVVVGNDDWLYYAGTLNDYQNRAPLRAGQARNIAHNVKMLQDYCEEHNASFVFTVAPDKNSLYGQSMPAYYPAVESQEREVLASYLKRAGVNYVDLFAALENAPERLYFYRDSHWTEKGALIAHDALAEAGGFQTGSFTQDDFIETDDYVGDLSSMLYPLQPEPEPNWYILGVNDGSGTTRTLRSGSDWNFIEGKSVEDPAIETTIAEGANTHAAEKNGSLLMFRDSFGNSLIPYLSCEFSPATYSKRIPYNALLVEELKPQMVIVERAQRHVGFFAEEAPLMECPTVALDAHTEIAHIDCAVTGEASENGPLACLQGFIEGVDMDAESEIYVRLTDSEGGTCIYRTFLISDEKTDSDQGYCLYVSKNLWANQDVVAEVILQQGEKMQELGSFNVRFDG